MLQELCKKMKVARVFETRCA